MIEDNIGKIIVVVVVVCIGLLTWGVISSNSNCARLINEKYGTNYTGGDMFLSGETIKEVLLGRQNNIKVEVTK